MKFYAYDSNVELRKERLGTDGKLLFDYKQYWRAIKHVERIFKGKNWSLYKYSNFYDDSTFRLLKRG